jgi:hypothetical protein
MTSSGQAPRRFDVRLAAMAAVAVVLVVAAGVALASPSGEVGWAATAVLVGLALLLTLVA